MKLYHIEVKQKEDDTLPRHLDSWVNERLENLPKIIKKAEKKYPNIQRFIIEIEVDCDTNGKLP